MEKRLLSNGNCQLVGNKTEQVNYFETLLVLTGLFNYSKLLACAKRRNEMKQNHRSNRFETKRAKPPETTAGSFLLRFGFWHMPIYNKIQLRKLATN